MIFFIEELYPKVHLKNDTTYQMALEIIELQEKNTNLTCSNTRLINSQSNLLSWHTNPAVLSRLKGLV